MQKLFLPLLAPGCDWKHCPGPRSPPIFFFSEPSPSGQAGSDQIHRSANDNSSTPPGAKPEKGYISGKSPTSVLQDFPPPGGFDTPVRRSAVTRSTKTTMTTHQPNQRLPSDENISAREESHSNGFQPSISMTHMDSLIEPYPHSFVECHVICSSRLTQHSHCGGIS